MYAPVVLIVDSDLGFVFWLGQLLDAAGYHTLPAKNVSDASLLLDQLKLQADVLIIGQHVPGAAAFAAKLNGRQQRFQHIVLYAEKEELSTASFPGVHAFCRNLSSRSQPAPELLDMLQGMFPSREV